MNGLRVSNKRLLCKLANQSSSTSYNAEYGKNPVLTQQVQSDNLYIKPLLPNTTEGPLPLVIVQLIALPSPLLSPDVTSPLPASLALLSYHVFTLRVNLIVLIFYPMSLFFRPPVLCLGISILFRLAFSLIDLVRSQNYFALYTTQRVLPHIILNLVIR